MRRVSALLCLIASLASAQVVPYTFSDPILYLRPTATATNLIHNLYGWWKMDDGSGGSASDSTGNGNTGTLQSTTWGTGLFNGCLEFYSPQQSSVQVGTISTQTLSGTITWWQYQTNVYNCGLSRGMWGWHPNLGMTWSGWVYTDNNWYLGFGYSPNPRIVLAADAGNWPTNVWMWYAFTWGTNGQHFYTNSVLCASNANNSGTNTLSTPFYIGRVGTASEWFTGKIDEFRIYDAKLTDNEISYLYHQWYGQP